MLPNLKDALNDVAKVFEFEQWLRFYYVSEEGDKLFIRVPDEKMNEIRSKFPTLARLAEEINDREIDFQKSQENVCAFVAAEFDGDRYPEGTVAQVLDKNDFKLEMYLFNLWARTHETRLDEEELSFDAWLRMYEEWRASPEVQKYLQNFVIQPQGVKTMQ
jgi:hypothetical protein